MQFDISLFLIGIPFAFALGWIASRLDIRQLRLENQLAPKSYFKGLTFLLNEQQDQAIDIFIEAVQKDPDTNDLHFALGNLFRRRGEYERAVRVHQYLLSRSDLSKEDRSHAQFELAQDYLKAGILDRAESALLQLKDSHFWPQALLLLLTNYEKSQDWERAIDIAQQLQGEGRGDFSNRRSHYLCELATQDVLHQRLDKALIKLQESIHHAPKNGRSYIAIAGINTQQNQHEQAWTTLMDGLIHAPIHTPLLAQHIVNSAMACRRAPETLDRLKIIFKQTPSLDVMESIVTLEQLSGISESSPRDWYIRYLTSEISLIAATHWLKGEVLVHNDQHDVVQHTLEMSSKPLMKYRCAACGFEVKQHVWQCPGCQTWDSYPALRIEEL